MSTVSMRVLVDVDYRSRLRLLSVAMGLSMGELVQRISQTKETIEELEQEYCLGKK